MSMNIKMLVVAGAAAMTALTSPAQAALLLSGSTFDLYLGHTDSQTGTFFDADDYTLTVDAPPQDFSFGTAAGTITNNETDLGGGSYRLLFTVSADQDLFPIMDTNPNGGYIGVGVLDSLDITAPFVVTSTQLTFLDGNGTTIASTDVPPTNVNPFDGAYPALGIIQGYDSIGGRDTRTISLSLTGNRIVPAVPEPATWAMMILGMGTIGLAIRGRKIKKDRHVRLAHHR